MLVIMALAITLLTGPLLTGPLLTGPLLTLFRQRTLAGDALPIPARS